MTVEIAGVGSGVNCARCNEVNGTYVLQGSGNCVWGYRQECTFEGGWPVGFDLTLTIWSNGDAFSPCPTDCGAQDYAIVVELHPFITEGQAGLEACGCTGDEFPEATGNYDLSNVIWRLCSSTKFDCRNLINVNIPFLCDDYKEPEFIGGCVGDGSTCKVWSGGTP